MENPDAITFTQLMKDSDRFMDEVNSAVQNALRVHKMLGYPVAVWRDGQVVWVPADEIPIKESNGSMPLPPSY